MHDLCVITSFNIKKMIKTWPIWFFSLLVLILAAGSLIYLSDSKKIDLIVDFGNSSLNLSDLNGSSELYENYKINQIKKGKRKPGKNEISITFNHIQDNRSVIKFRYGENVSKNNALENTFLAMLQKIQISNIILQSSEVINEYKIEEPAEEKISSELFSFIVLFLTYGFTLLCGATITSSVATEKISKVSDLIIYRTNPVNLVYGKILALFAVVGTIISVLALEVYALIKFNNNVKVYISEIFKDVDISWQNILLILGMSLCAIVIYTLMYALVGMFVQDQQQLQFAQLPVTILLIVSFVSTYFSILHPNTLISNIGVYIPLISPFIFVDKVLNGFTQMELLGFISTELLFLVFCNFIIMRIFIPKKYY